MLMAIKSKMLKVNSLVVNKEFLEKLGGLLESDIKNKTIFTYTIDAGDELLQYASMKDILSIDTFPQNIKSMVFRVTDVDFKEPIRFNVSLRLNNNVDSVYQCAISSEDESKVLLFEKRIKNLVNEYETDYGYLYKIPGFSPISGLLLILSLFLFFDNLMKSSKVLQSLTFLVVFLPFIITWLIGTAFKFLYPKYSFELSNKDRSRTVFRGILWTIVLAIIVETAINVVTWILSFK